MEFLITGFGAVPGTEALQTAAIQRALDACAGDGGGTVVIPPGVFRTGSVRIGSHTTLRLEKGATLLGPDSMDGYVRHPFAWDLYSATTPLFYAVDAEDIRIEGEGVVDFNGRAFAHWDNPCNGTSAELPEELKNDPHVEMPPRDERPNRLVFFQSCKDIEISGVTFTDSPTWTLVFHRGSHISIHDLRIENHRRIPNNDGIHCYGCRDVAVTRCIITCGDDCIALTSISDASAITQNVRISDCVFHSSSAALRIGFQSGKVRDVAVRDCVIRDSNRAVAVFAGKDGYVEDVTLSGLLIETRIFAGCWWGKGEPLVVCATEPGAKIRNVRLLDSKIKAENSIVLAGNCGGIDGVELANLDIHLGYGKARPLFGKDWDLSPHPHLPAPDAAKRIPWLWSQGATHLKIERITVNTTDSFSTEAMVDHD